MNEIEIIRSRICSVLSTSIKSSLLEGDALSLYDENTVYDEDGICYFADLDYSFDNRGAWGGRTAVCRIFDLVLLYLNLPDTSKRSLAKKLFLEHLRSFSIKKYSNSNWWYNDIGLPCILGPILLLVGDELAAEVYDGLFEMLERGVIRVHGEILTTDHGHYQGANLLWYCENSIYHAVLTGDGEELSLASKALCKETYGREEAGLQSDGSFFQHGKFLYTMGYGFSYFTVFAKMIYYLDSTRYALTREATDNVLRHLLDGMRFMSYGKGIDYLTVGREYTRENVLDNRKLIESVECFSKSKDITRQNEVFAFLEALKKKTGTPLGCKYFDVAHYLVTQNEYLHIGYRTMGEGMICTEICNRENVLGYNLAYGTNTCVMRDGREYYNISPIWKYDYMPGTTTFKETDEELRSHSEFDASIIGTVSYCPDIKLSGGLNAQDVSVSYYSIVHSGTHQKVSAIATRHGMILVGSDIFNENGKELHTTVEQCNLLSDVTVDRESGLVEHNGICYINLMQMNPFEVTTEHRVGDWSRNRLFSRSEHYECDVLSVYIDHKNENVSYAYEILPKEYLSERASVFHCDENLHAIRLADKREIYVFYNDFAYSDKIFGKAGDVLIIEP